MGQKHFAVLTRVFYKKMYDSFLPGGQKSGRNNEATVLPRWPEGGVSLYFQREAQSIHMGTGAGGQKGVTLII